MTVPRNQNSINTCFAATQIAARQAIVATIARLPDLGISDSRCGDIEIALAEAINNVVEHACANLPDASGCITCLIYGDTLIVEIYDTGRALPDSRPPTGTGANLAVPVPELPEGGFGWSLIHRITANVAYERTGNLNCLRLEFEVDKNA